MVPTYLIAVKLALLRAVRWGVLSRFHSAQFFRLSAVLLLPTQFV